jgi:hypothetical protein
MPTTNVMPCRFSLFKPCVSYAKPDPGASAAAGNLEAYITNRRTTLFHLRRQTRLLVFLFALLESVWRGPLELVFSKNFDAAIDHGFVYSVGYFLSWLYMCVVGIIYGALFEASLLSLTCLQPTNITQWWLPSLPPPPPVVENTASTLNKVNMVLLPSAIGIVLGTWAIMVFMSFKKDQHASLVHTSRFKQVIVTLATTSWVTAFGYFSLEHLSKLNIARVRWQMDAWVLLPIGINIGIALGTAAISKSERKRVAREEARHQDQAISVEEFLAEEKRPLVEV